MQPTDIRYLAATSLLALAFAAGTARAEDSEEALGKARFEQRCAVCHGKGAKGDGPFAKLLTKAPPDLTMLAHHNKGTFPFDRVYDSVDGRTLPIAHGTRDMPIWGKALKGAGLGGESDARSQLLETVIYLRSIQAP